MARVREYLFDRFFGDIHDRRIAALREAHGRAREDEGWRRLTDADRDLAPVTHDRMREIAVYLWTYNPLAKRIINSTVEWIVGEGVQIRAEHPKTQAYLERFWADPVNRWDLRLEEKTRELFLFGEQFWPAFTNQFDGMMHLGVLDPSRVKEVITDPDNAQTVIGVVTKSRHGQSERRIRTILRGPEEQVLSPTALAERERFEDGELFAFAINKLSTMTRGISELFALADWLDGYEQLLFSIMAQEKVRSSYLWDITLEGADEPEIEAKLKTLQAPKPMSVRVHNEKEKWALVGPEAGAGSNNGEIARLFRNHLLGGAAIPEHWYGGGGDVNRATAAEMASPSEKSFTARQKTARYVFEDVFAAQIERGIATGALPDEDEVRDAGLVFPDLSTRDITRAAGALQQLASGLALGKQEGWVSDDVAARVLTAVMSHLGVDADPEEMLKAARSTLADEISRTMDRRMAVVE